MFTGQRLTSKHKLSGNDTQLVSFQLFSNLQNPKNKVFQRLITFFLSFVFQIFANSLLFNLKTVLLDPYNKSDRAAI
ncbi:MAG: hypothetical protein DHS20C18_55380 [Saprospiraceae bacterium]|nr:MAG: hypothetical protein DHS20C18_55380 [Saprospiraceae bacterium]